MERYLFYYPINFQLQQEKISIPRDCLFDCVYFYMIRNVSSYQQAQAAPTLERNGGGGRWGGGDACPRCCKQVYFAEEVRAVGKKWHKMCLSCGEMFVITTTVSCYINLIINLFKR